MIHPVLYRGTVSTFNDSVMFALVHYTASTEPITFESDPGVPGSDAQRLGDAVVR